MATVDAIIAGKYPAKAHARRVAQQLATNANGSPAVIYLEAQKTRLIEDNDEPMPFRYVSFMSLHSCRLLSQSKTNQYRLSGSAALSSTCLVVCYRIRLWYTTPALTN